MILIKGMKIPFCCPSCFISRFGNMCFCGKKINHEEWNDTSKRPDWYPLTEAPEPCEGVEE